MKQELRWVAPPGWPQVPEGWEPPDGWVPDPAWPEPRPGWQFWQRVPAPAVVPPSRRLNPVGWAVVGVLVLGAAIVGVVSLRPAATSPSAPASLVVPSDLVPPALPYVAPPDPPSPAAAQLSAADAAKQNDKGWVLEDMRRTPPTDGSAGEMTARIKNANPSTAAAFFTLTLLDGQTSIASWHGAANGVLPGQTATVTMLSADSLPPGSRTGHFNIQFQTDTSVSDG